MVGTAVTLLTHSRSMRSSATSGSHLCMRTTVPPPQTCAQSAEWQPVPWKSGTGTSTVDGSGGAVGIGIPARMAPRAVANWLLTTLLQRLRCVPSTPLGRFVVPDV
jgi:hypothetical protein